MATGHDFIAMYVHGSREVKDYSLNWSSLLAAEGDAESTSSWSNEADSTCCIGDGVNGAPAPTYSAGIATVWVVRGTVGDVYWLTNLLTTTQGRTFERTIRLAVIDR